MAISTTQSVWRSGGGDQTRTAACGSMQMSTPFYIANAAASANVTNVSGTSGQPVILPAGAVVTSIAVTGAGTSGTINLGFTPLSGVGPGQTTTLGTNVPTAFVSNGAVSRGVISIGAATGGNSLGNVANATNLIVVTSASNATGLGAVTGIINYFVYDAGVQNV